MSKENLITAAIAILLSLPAYSQRESLKATFSGGIPEDFKTLNLDGMNISPKYFNNATMPQDIWYACNEKGIGEETCEFIDPEVTDAAIGARYGLLSCSRRTDINKSTDNWLILPQLKITDGFGLRWCARSIHFNFRETYKIMVSVTDQNPASFEEIYRVEDESYLWRERYLDLSRYAGQNVYVAIVHCSTNKYLLALDYVEAGVSDDIHLDAQNSGRHYFGASETPSLQFSVFNHGGDVDVKAFEIRRNDDGEILGSSSALNDNIFIKGSSRDIIIPLENYDGSCYYDLVAILEDGSECVILNDFVNKSDFARKMYVMKLTGTWCNSCPKVGYAAHLAQELLGDECVYAEIHHEGTGVDKDGYADFINEYPYSVRGDYPALWYNLTHNKDSYRYRDYTAFKKAVLTPCMADVKIGEAVMVGDKLRVKATVRFAADMDNSADRYRVGIIFADKEVTPHPASSEQMWQSPGGAAAYGEYFFMPSSFPKDLNPLEHVVRSPREGAKGIPASLPADIKAMQEYTVEYDVDYTESFRAENIIAIANVIDSESKTFEVLNSDIADVKGTTAPELRLVPSDDEIVEGNKCRIDVYGLAIDEAVVWSTSDEKVATVEDGYVTAVAEGTVVITAETNKGRKADCTLKVKKSNAIETLNTNDMTISRRGNFVSIQLPDGDSMIYIYGLAGELKKSMAGHGETVTISLPEVSIIRIEKDGKTYSRKI